mgnify:CR=1 FL=1
MKNSNIKKIIAGICLVTMTLTGCSNSKNNSSTAGSGVKILYTYSIEQKIRYAIPFLYEVGRG